MRRGRAPGARTALGTGYALTDREPGVVPRAGQWIARGLAAARRRAHGLARRRSDVLLTGQDGNDALHALGFAPQLVHGVPQLPHLRLQGTDARIIPHQPIGNGGQEGAHGCTKKICRRKASIRKKGAC